MKKLLLSLALILPAFAAQSFETPAKQAMLLDATHNTVLFDKASDEQMTPSSMSKLMTLYALFQDIKDGKLSLEDDLPVSEKAWRMGGSKMFVRVDTRVKVEDLIQGIAVQSGNDACVVVAEGLSGTEEAFAERLNRLADELGLKHSHFVNATGWPDEGHVMSPHDLVILTQKMRANFPEMMHYFTETEFSYNDIFQYNRHPLLGGELGVTGMKTGHTDAGGYGVVISASKDGRDLVAVINGLESSDARRTEAERIIRYGFDSFETYNFLEGKDITQQVSVIDGKPNNVTIAPMGEAMVLIEKGTQDTLRGDIIMLDDKPVAPLPEGTILGTLNVTQDGNVLAEVPLATTTTIERAGFFKRKWDAFKRWKDAE